MDNFKNGKFLNIIIASASIILAGVAIFTAINIYKSKTKPVTPTVPQQSQAQETTPEGCIPCDLTFFTVNAQEPSNTPTPTKTPTPTATGTVKPTNTPTATQTPTPTATKTPIPTGTLNPTSTPIITNTPTPTSTVRSVVTNTPKPSTQPDALPDAGISYPTIALFIFGALLLTLALVLVF